jgi:hypothetical protein
MNLSTVAKTKAKTVTTTSNYQTDITPNVSYIPDPFTRGTNPLEARQQTAFPSDTPDCGSVCPGISRYSSACFRIGAKAATTTLPPKITTMVTATKTNIAEYDLPIFMAHQWVYVTCSQEIGNDFPSTILFERGKCVTSRSPSL